jgi:hypothetical protein
MRCLVVVVGLLAGVLALGPGPAEAQYSGHNFRGDYGITSGSQPPPGFYVPVVYLRYDADRLLDRNGDEIREDLPGSLDANGFATGFWWVSDFKILGANYGILAFPAWTDNKFEVPILDLETKASFGFTDLYFQPINLGWHTSRADFTAGLGIYAPTGSYDVEASDNLGLGMWSFEPYVGATVYFDEKKSWSLAATAFYEMHSKKKDTDIKVGDLLTIEGGLGKSFMDGAVVVGLAYFGQWKVTDDDLGLDLGDLGDVLSGFIGKNRVYGAGPELTLPIATKKKLIATLNARYFWEWGARSTLEGQTFIVTATFPIPSVSLQ